MFDTATGLTTEIPFGGSRSIDGNTVLIAGSETRTFDLGTGVLSSPVVFGLRGDPYSIDSNRFVYHDFDGLDLDLFLLELGTGSTTQLTSDDLPSFEAVLFENRVA